MVFVKDAADVLEVFVVLGLLKPRDREQRLDVAHDEGGLQRGFRHHLVTLEFFLDLRFDVLGIGILLELFSDRVFGMLVIRIFAELLFDGFHPLSEDVVLLGFIRGFADLIFDLRVDLRGLLGLVDIAKEKEKALGDIDFLQHRFFLLQSDRKIGGDGVGKLIASFRRFGDLVQSTAGKAGA